MASEHTLAERLGHAADARLLIINCDDFGSSHAANTAITRSLEEGVATSATLMVPCPWAREAVRLAQGRDVGVHLTLTCEYPGYRWRAVTGARSLHDGEGFMPATAAEVHARADPADTYAECRAQIEQAIAWGLDPTHLDSHMGTVQTEPRFFDIYLRLADEFDLPLRMLGRRADQWLGFHGRERAAAGGSLFNEHFVSPWPRDTLKVLADRIPQLAPGVTEAYAHPVDDGPELWGYDPDHPDIRACDAIALCDPGLKAIIDRAGVTLISYRALRELQRSERRGAS
jgi:predicted glycoside hydrolase/deacetylase ChbG (UPF0249 family)